MSEAPLLLRTPRAQRVQPVEPRPYWHLGDDLEEPYWKLGSLRTRPPLKRTSMIYRTSLAAPELLERATVGGASILSMRFALFGVWQEINSAEGHFLERIQRGAFAKSIRESLRNIRALLSHGKDPSLGSTVLGKVESIEEAPDAAIARVSLFPSVPPLLLDGLAAQQYGASFRGEAVKSHVEQRPGRSAHNPLGIPEITRQEIRLRDIGPTAFPQYAATTAELAAALEPTRSRPAGELESERPAWYLGDEPDFVTGIERLLT